MKFLRILLLPLLSVLLVSENQALGKRYSSYFGASSIGKSSEKTDTRVSNLFKQGGVNLTRAQQKAINSYTKQIANHKNKLADYIKNPDAFDNRGLLKNATPELRKKIINSRIRLLKGEIQAFENHIKSVKDGKMPIVIETDETQ